MEDFSLRQLWRLTNVLFRVRNGALIHKDVKNEDRTDYVYEKKWRMTQCPRINTIFWPRMHRFRDNGRQSMGFLAENARITR